MVAREVARGGVSRVERVEMEVAVKAVKTEGEMVEAAVVVLAATVVEVVASWAVQAVGEG